MIAFLRWLRGLLRRRGPAPRSLIVELSDRVVEVIATDEPCGCCQRFDLVILSGADWTAGDAERVLAFFRAELDRLKQGKQS